MGIVPTRSGSVNTEGTELSALKSYERVAEGLAYVPQYLLGDDGQGKYRDRSCRLGRKGSP